MKKNWLSTGLLVTGLVSTGLLGAVACGGDKNETENSGGARSTESVDLSSLESDLAELRSELENAGAEERQALLDEIEALEAELSKLSAPPCGLGGECTAMATAITALTPVMEAMCTSAFECCTAGQAHVQLGRDVDNVVDCVAAMTAQAKEGHDINGLADGFFQIGITFDMPEMDQLANSMEHERIAIDEDKLAECVAAIESFDCNKTGFDYGCKPLASPCDDDNFIIGLVEEGGSCDTDSTYDECAGPAFCSGDGKNAICLTVEVDKTECRSDADCGFTYQPSDLGGLEYTADYFCDLETGTCAEAGDAGDDCDFGGDDWADGPLLLEKPCKKDLLCSPISRVCVPACSAGAPCNSDTDDCMKGHDCKWEEQRQATRNNMIVTSYGICEELADLGEDCNFYGACKSQACDDGTCVVSCRVDPSLCTADEWCTSTTNICATKDALGEACTNDSSCAEGVCQNQVCTVAVSGGNCGPGTGPHYDRVCPGDEYCFSNTCTPKIALAGACTADNVCLSGFCDDGACAALPSDSQLEEGAACDAEDSAGVYWSAKARLDPCEEGTYCRPTDSSSYSGTCVKQLAAGAICDPDVDEDIHQCDSEKGCFVPSGTSTGLRICPAENNWEQPMVCNVASYDIFED